jgi:AP-1-like factor
MEAFPDVAPLWDLSQASSFSQLPDDDFLALLQKQFPSRNTGSTYNTGGFIDGVNPQNISRYSLPSITPPSEDSSPSPPNINNDSGTQGLLHGDNDDPSDPALKRKASDENFDEGPSQKNQHTCTISSTTVQIWKNPDFIILLLQYLTIKRGRFRPHDASRVGEDL